MHVLLTFGEIDALIPLLVIIVLIAAAAGLTRGYDVFKIFGIGALAGIGAGLGRSRGSMMGKTGYVGVGKTAFGNAHGAAGKLRGSAKGMAKLARPGVQKLASSKNAQAAAVGAGLLAAGSKIGAPSRYMQNRAKQKQVSKLRRSASEYVDQKLSGKSTPSKLTTIKTAVKGDTARKIARGAGGMFFGPAAYRHINTGEQARSGVAQTEFSSFTEANSNQALDKAMAKADKELVGGAEKIRAQKDTTSMHIGERLVGKRRNISYDQMEREAIDRQVTRFSSNPSLVELSKRQQLTSTVNDYIEAGKKGTMTQAEIEGKMDTLFSQYASGTGQFSQAKLQSVLKTHFNATLKNAEGGTELSSTTVGK